jgi:hypothetical protein
MWFNIFEQMLVQHSKVCELLNPTSLKILIVLGGILLCWIVLQCAIIGLEWVESCAIIGWSVWEASTSIFQEILYIFCMILSSSSSNA